MNESISHWRNGQLGSELKKITRINNNFEWIFTDRMSFDLLALDYINLYLDKCKPEVILNCAAYTSVNSAENCYEMQI